MWEVKLFRSLCSIWNPSPLESLKINFDAINKPDYVSLITVYRDNFNNIISLWTTRNLSGKAILVEDEVAVLTISKAKHSDSSCIIKLESECLAFDIVNSSKKKKSCIIRDATNVLDHT